MLPLATQNSLLVEWLVPFQTGFPPALFQAFAGRTACHQCSLRLRFDRLDSGLQQIRMITYLRKKRAVSV